MALGAAASTWQNRRLPSRGGGGSMSPASSNSQWGTVAGQSPYGPYRPENGGFKPHPQYTPVGRQMTQIFGMYQPPPNYTDPTMGSRYIGGQREIDRQKGFLQTGYGFDNRDIDLRMAELGIDRGANARDRAYYEQLLGLMPEQRAIVGDTYNNQVQELQNRAATNVRDINTEATAGGSWLAPRRGTKVADEFKNYETGKTSADLARRSSTVGLTEKELGLTRNRDMTDDQTAKLDLMGQRYGLDRERLAANLENGLAQLGYSEFINYQDLLDKAGSSNAQVAQQAQQILNDAAQMGMVYSGGALGDAYNRYAGTGTG